jgi:hypothetical protein
MAKDWEETFGRWIKRPSDAEQTRYENTRDAIREALKTPALDGYSFSVYAKGSYPNFTNVVRDSDVDVAVELTTFFGNDFTHDAEGLTLADVGVTPYTGDATLAGFKNDVEAALIADFGAAAVGRGNKAIHIRETSRALKADVVPCVHQRVWHNRFGYNDGIKLRDDSEPENRIINYPKQHLDRGVEKNDRCSRRYKRVVRILKNLENEMVSKGVISVVPSFLIESGVYNVPDADLRDPATWTARTRHALAHIFNGTRSDDCISSDDWLEANGIKYLFHSTQGWTYQDLHRFASAAWDYLGFE